MFKLLSALSKYMDTLANPIGLRISVPANITSSIFPPRRFFADCSPRTQRTASDTLLFPDPLGPTIHVIPSLKSNVNLSANDLNPYISNFLRSIVISHFHPKKHLFLLIEE